jgi:hypothetical protein
MCKSVEEFEEIGVMKGEMEKMSGENVRVARRNED